MTIASAPATHPLALPNPGVALSAEAVAHRVRDLPALPAALTEALAALRSERLNTERLAQLLERDQALCGRTLRLANSAFYGLQGHVGTVHDALRLLGLRTVGSMMGAASLAGYAHVARCPGFDFNVYWRHSLAVSMAAREIAVACGHDGDQAAVAGLLHDVGQLAMVAYFPDAFAAALDLGRTADCEPLQAERSVLGLDHAQVGGMVAQHWRLPPAMVQAIAAHHEPPALAPTGMATALTDVVHLADAMAHALDLAQDPQECVPNVSLDSWERLNAGRLDTAALFTTVEEGVAAMAASLNL
jgi:putative nucleotidyltransferase with HDIG domain